MSKTCSNMQSMATVNNHAIDCDKNKQERTQSTDDLIDLIYNNNVLEILAYLKN